jgi:hypothetical protein
MSDGSQEADPKLVIDESWKAQVEREKQEAAAKEEALAREKWQAKKKESAPLPSASFEMLVGTLSTQALNALGYFADPTTGVPNVDRDVAKLFIDLLAVAEDKTRGNLTDEESKVLTETLHQLRIAFVTPRPPMSGAEAPSKPPADEPKSRIELP